MRWPFHAFDDCAGMHYRIQLNGYKYILEKYYGYRVVRRFVVCTHPDNGTQPFVDAVPSMAEEVEGMTQDQRQRVREVRAMRGGDTRPT